MRHLTAIIIGAGQSGIAISQELSLRGVDHVILEGGEAGNSWRKERWDGLRLLTPNWLNGLPGQPYDGSDMDGYMSVAELIHHFDRLVGCTNLPIQTNSTVHSVRAENGRYLVQSSQGEFVCENLVIATGPCAKAKRPRFAAELPQEIVELTPLTYKHPSDLPDGGTLVVGASASGVQIARDIQLSGRQVTLAVGSHTRVPRHYRGADILTWMHLLGLLDTTYGQVDDVNRVRRTPSFQLTGDPERGTFDLNSLQEIGVEIVGRLAGINGGRAAFSGGLANVCAAADLKMNRLISAIDEWVDEKQMSELVDRPYAHRETRLPKEPRLTLNFAAEGIRSVVWATGFHPDHSFLELPVFDQKGQIRHTGGYVMPGLYVMGLPFLRRRSSTLILGASDDARDISHQLVSELGHRRAA